MPGWWNGIHERLKIAYRKVCGFESHPGHLVLELKSYRLNCPCGRYLKMKTYLHHNKKVYEALAPEFESKIKIRQRNTQKALKFFMGNHKRGAKKDVLEIGPGSGLLSKLLADKGFFVTALEFSPNMAEICKKVAPKTKVIVDEFLAHDFKKQKFSGVVALAFIHLFPKKLSQGVLKKIKSLLRPGGIALISTTRHAHSQEGLFIKKNFNAKLKRFRRKFTRSELEKELKRAGLIVLAQRDIPDAEEKNKVWMDYLVS
jgi:2-polyprenyl-3-methyl-5-hydroxy-6-metoxy-1,4-benzoquinol methylase